MASGQCRGIVVDHIREGEKLGVKLYDILKTSELSYRVSYDFVSSKRILTVWQGFDRTNSQYENNPVTFSTKYGNLKNPNVLLEESNYCNCGIVTKSMTYGAELDYIRAVLEAPDSDYRFSYISANIHDNDYGSREELFAAMENAVHVELQNYTKTVSAEFDIIEGGYEYMQDFDLGDKCNIEIHEIGFSAVSRLIGCYEVIKNGECQLTLEFGTPIINKTRRI